MVADPLSTPAPVDLDAADAAHIHSIDDPYIRSIVAAGVRAFKQATPSQVDELRRLFAPLVRAARTSQP